MLEIHPFGNFVPKDAKYLVLGSFTGKPEHNYDWFYSTKRNQFWSIIEAVYGVELKSKREKQAFFALLKMAIADIIYSCERKSGNNQDNNLTNIISENKQIKIITMPSPSPRYAKLSKAEKTKIYKKHLPKY